MGQWFGPAKEQGQFNHELVGEDYTLNLRMTGPVAVVGYNGQGTVFGCQLSNDFFFFLQPKQPAGYLEE